MFVSLGGGISQRLSQGINGAEHKERPSVVAGARRRHELRNYERWRFLLANDEWRMFSGYMNCE